MNTLRAFPEVGMGFVNYERISLYLRKEYPTTFIYEGDSTIEAYVKNFLQFRNHPIKILIGLLEDNKIETAQMYLSMMVQNVENMKEIHLTVLDLVAFFGNSPLIKRIDGFYAIPVIMDTTKFESGCRIQLLDDDLVTLELLNIEYHFYGIRKSDDRRVIYAHYSKDAIFLRKPVKCVKDMIVFDKIFSENEKMNLIPRDHDGPVSIKAYSILSTPKTLVKIGLDSMPDSFKLESLSSYQWDEGLKNVLNKYKLSYQANKLRINVGNDSKFDGVFYINVLLHKVITFVELTIDCYQTDYFKKVLKWLESTKTIISAAYLIDLIAVMKELHVTQQEQDRRAKKIRNMISAHANSRLEPSFVQCGDVKFSNDKFPLLHMQDLKTRLELKYPVMVYYAEPIVLLDFDIERLVDQLSKDPLNKALTQESNEDKFRIRND